MLNLFQHLIQLITYAGETLNQVQGDESKRNKLCNKTNYTQYF